MTSRTDDVTDTAFDEPVDDNDDADRATDDDALDDDAEAEERDAAKRVAAPTPGWITWLMVASIVLAVATSAGTAWVYFSQFRPSHEVTAEDKSAVLTAAADGTVAVLSYAPATLDADFARAKSHLTGEFLDYYAQFTEKLVGPAATNAEATSTATVERSAISDITPDSATALLFVNQSQSSKDKPQPGLAMNVVRVELQKINGVWLIAQFGPV